MADKSRYNRFNKRRLAEFIIKRLENLENVTKKELITFLEVNDRKKDTKRTLPKTSHGKPQVVAARAAPVSPRKGRIVQSPKRRLDSKQQLNKRLLYAANEGDLEIVERVIENGADVNAIFPREMLEFEGYGRSHPIPEETALLSAIKRGNIEIIKVLVRAGADVNATDSKGINGLILAVYNGNIKIVEYMIKSGADVNSRNQSGTSAVMIASQYGKTKIVELLIINGADVNATNDSGETPLMRAAHNKIIEILISAGADPSIKNIHGLTARDIYEIHGMEEEFDQIVKQFTPKMVKAASSRN